MKKYLLLPLFLSLYEFVLNISNDMYVPALPEVAKSFSIESSLAKISIIIWFVGGSVSQILMGTISDKYGRRPVLLLGGCIFTIATFFCAVTSFYYCFLISRFFQGFSVGTIIVTSYAIVNEYYEDKEATKILSFLGATVIIAPMLGPTIGGVLITFMTWNGLFFISLLTNLVVIIVLLYILPETKANSNNSNSISLQEFYMPFIKLLRNRIFVTNLLIASAGYSIAIAWITSSPFLFIERYNFSSIEYGNLQILIFAGYLLGTQVLRILLNIYSKEYIITIGVNILFISSAILLISSFLLVEDWRIIVLCISINNLSGGICAAPINRIIIKSSTEQVGVTIAAFEFAILTFGSAIGGIASFAVQDSKLFAITIFALSILALISNIFRQNNVLTISNVSKGK